MLAPVQFRAPRQRAWTIVLLALAILGLAGCSAEAKKARHLKQADEFYAAGLYDRAEIEYLNVYKLDSQNAHALSRLGMICLNQGRMGRALESLSRAKVLKPSDPEIQRTLGRLYLAVGYRSDARSEALALLDQSPEDPDAPVILAEAAEDPDALTAARVRLEALGEEASVRAPVLVALGIIDARQGRIENAQQRFEKAVAADPKYAAAHAAMGAVFTARNELDRADASLARAATLSGPRSPHGVQLAQLKIQRGDIAGGRRVLEDIIAQAPDFLPARLRLVDLALTLGQFDQAETQLAPILASDPTHAEALLASSRIHLAQKDTTKALAQIEVLLRMYPQSPEALLQHARVLVARNDLPGALTSLNQALVLRPDFRDAILELANLRLRQGETSAAVALLRSWLDKFPGPEIHPELIDGFLLLAEALRRQGNFNETLVLYGRIERVVPGREQFPLMRGFVRRQQNQIAEARAAFLEAQQRNPDSVIAVEQLAELDVLEGKPAEARARVDAALGHQPRQVALHLLSAKLFLAERQTGPAEIALRRCLELDPGMPQPYLPLARVQLESGNADGALVSLRALVQLSPGDTEAWFLLGTLLEQRREFAAAREAYESLLKVEPRHPGGLNNLAHLLFHKFKEPERGYALALQAREQAPGDAKIADTLGWILYHRGDYNWALGLLRESAGKMPGAAEAVHHLAMTHYMLADEAAARPLFERALALDGAFPSADEARARLGVLRVNRTGIDPEGRTFLEKHLAANPTDPVALSRLATVHEQEDRLGEAIALQERAVRASPQAVRPAATLARLLADADRPAAALEQARSARKLAPNDSEVAFELGQLAYRLRDYPWAYDLLRDASRRPPASAEALYAFAGAAYSVGRVAEARAGLLAALNHAPKPAGRARLALIDAAGAQASAVAAVPAARLQLATDPDDVAALMVLATAALTPTEGQPLLERVLSIYPEFVPAKRQLVFLLENDPAQDRRTLELGSQAYEVLRDDSELSRLLGTVSYRLKNYRRAIGWLDNAKVKLGGDATLWFQLGISQSALNQVPAARESLEKALSLGLSEVQTEEARTVLEALKPAVVK